MLQHYKTFKRAKPVWASKVSLSEQTTLACETMPSGYKLNFCQSVDFACITLPTVC